MKKEAKNNSDSLHKIWTELEEKEFRIKSKWRLSTVGRSFYLQKKIGNKWRKLSWSYHLNFEYLISSAYISRSKYLTKADEKFLLSIFKRFKKL